MSISEIQVGSLIRVKVGKNLILAEVVEILENGFRVQSLSTYKEFNVPESRVHQLKTRQRRAGLERFEEPC